ncbi:MAG: aminotransferase class I/II-fold pyridoxal phosphate-dependent enzyme [Gammaproteobacteria bacterium]|jgi:cystathionine beta-lyase|nr:aminotransferase class I/II-fold pyridoxal phosphate-dependent enzyme [Gammaproteobacteria bacterium]
MATSKSSVLSRRAFLSTATSAGIATAAGVSHAAVTPLALTPGVISGQSPLQQIPISTARYAGRIYDFDTPYDRKGSDCSRWDGAAAPYPDGVFKYGMGVASQDFECAPCITDALAERIAHHNWGYLASSARESLTNEIIKWNGERNALDLDSSQITMSDGVYPGLIAALRAFTPPGGKTLIITPAYSGFYTMAREANIGTVDSPMQRINGRYEVDWEDLEAKMTADVHTLIVCNPQNPTGNVWRADELERMGQLALDHNIIVLADEIHADIVRRGHRYTPFAGIKNKAVVDNSVSFAAISKTFNMAGLKNAYYYSSNPALLGRVNQQHWPDINTLGVVATEAAYKYGGEWFDQANAYMDDTHQFIEDYIADHMPLVGYTRNEGTYMTFVDFSQVIAKLGPDELRAKYGRNTTEEAFQDWLVYNTGVFTNPGSWYGTGGDGHMRFNIASSRLVMQEVFDSMASAINKI